MSISATYRMIPDTKKGGGTLTTTGGRAITVAQNTYQDMPIDDAVRLQGWLNCGLVGTTAQRPSNAASGIHYIDTTLSKVVVSDGAGYWHDPFTGGVV
jgi:hypothetical protein